MSNMSYCRFRNTLKDLRDCWDNWEFDNDADDAEKVAQIKLLDLCKEIAREAM